MIRVYKMGMSYYLNSIDKNSGMTEVKIITEELKKIKTDKNILVIINGIRDEADNTLLSLINDYDLSIFIMSDSVALETSLDIMNACDIVLHQAPHYNFDNIKSLQYYSYVPELFYKYCKELLSQGKIKTIDKKIDMIYFGGNNKNRDDKFKAYKVGKVSTVFSRHKLYETGEDLRISHNEYLKELSEFLYSLVICREDYRKIGWITSRYFEAIALGNIPFIDFEYDMDNFLVNKDSFLRVNNYESMISIRNYLKQNPDIAKQTLNELKSKAEESLDKFYLLIEEIINK